MSRIQPVLIETELQQSFLEYAMSVIVRRALPDVRDGLKPVHRRILYTMHQLGFTHNKPYHKSVRVVGDVLGKYHPHGDAAVYQTMVGLVQDFAKRYPLLDGQGNWGSVDGDNAAAMRYTETRMQRIAQEILADIEKETVHFVPNFDESTTEPSILPSRIPLMLINGASGIAVGMATSIPPHNLREVIDACCALLLNEDLSQEELFSYITAPDFPTGGIICGRAGLIKAYTTGSGNVILRGVATVVETKKGSSLIITELPYQVVKAELVIKIADLVKDKVIDGITNIRDESNRQGMRLVIDIRRGESPEVILNLLYKHTSLQTTVPILMLGLIDNKPRVFTLKELLYEFICYREQIVLKRTQFDLRKIKEREHILQGLEIAIRSVDDIIVLIKSAPDPRTASQLIQSTFHLSEIQAQAVLELRLQRLTSLEQNKITDELEEIMGSVKHLESIVGDRALLKQEIINELQKIKGEYGDDRRTRIEGPLDAMSEADFIPDDEVVVTLTRKGYIKRVPLEVYGLQHRGGKGKIGIGSLDDAEDVIEDMFVSRNHDELLFFTSIGRVYGMHVYHMPEASRTARGRAIVNILPLQPGESVVKLLCARDFASSYLCLVTERGLIKRTEARLFTKIRQTGMRAITLNEGDKLAFCGLSSGEESVVLVTAQGKGIRFLETEVRSMGRHAAGVVGIRLKENDLVVGMQIVQDEQEILFATEYGYGKRVQVADFRVAHRGGQGVLTIPTDSRNGLVLGVIIVYEGAHLLLIDTAGKLIRLSSAEVRTMGRQAKGVRLIRLDKGQKLSAVVAVPASEEHVTEVVTLPADQEKETES